MKKQLKLIFYVALVLGCRISEAAVLPIQANGVNWTYYYNPDVNPDMDYYDKLPTETGATTPVWSYVGLYDASQTIVDDYMRLATTGEDSQAHYFQTTGWNGALDTTLEVRLRVVETTGYWANAFFLSTGSKWATVDFNSTSILSLSGLDLSEWTVIRFTLTGGATNPDLNIYINNNPTAFTISGLFVGDTSDNYLRFGDIAPGGYAGGIVDYDYIRWTSAGAFAPVPEPGTSVLLGLAAVLGTVLGVRRRKRVGRSLSF